MDTLAQHIERNLKEREFCVVFEDELERCWPSEKMDHGEREKEIQTFAKLHGWNASIINTDSGLLRAIFWRQTEAPHRIS